MRLVRPPGQVSTRPASGLGPTGAGAGRAHPEVALAVPGGQPGLLRWRCRAAVQSLRPAPRGPTAPSGLCRLAQVLPDPLGLQEPLPATLPSVAVAPSYSGQGPSLHTSPSLLSFPPRAPAPAPQRGHPAHPCHPTGPCPQVHPQGPMWAGSPGQPVAVELRGQPLPTRPELTAGLPPPPGAGPGEPPAPRLPPVLLLLPPASAPTPLCPSSSSFGNRAAPPPPRSPCLLCFPCMYPRSPCLSPGCPPWPRMNTSIVPLGTMTAWPTWKGPTWPVSPHPKTSCRLTLQAQVRGPWGKGTGGWGRSHMTRRATVIPTPTPRPHHLAPGFDV